MGDRSVSSESVITEPTSRASSGPTVEDVERMLDAVLDDIAEASGVDRRTLFRHVESRNALVADAFSSAMDWFRTGVDRAVPADRPLEDWITELVLEILQVHIGAGRGLWQLAATPDSELPPELAAVNARRRSDRQRTIPVVADPIWQRAGGLDAFPQMIVDAAGIAISAFTAKSMIDDLERDPGEIAHHVAEQAAPG